MPLLKHSNVLKIQDIFLTRIKLINFPTLCKRSFASHWDDFVPLEWVISRILSPFRGGDHPSRENRYRFPQATYPRISCGRHNPPIWSCSGWGLPDRPVTRSVGELLPHHFTLTPQTRGGMFLWHFPWGHPHWVLPSTLPSGVRTFLRRCRSRRPPDPLQTLPIFRVNGLIGQFIRVSVFTPWNMDYLMGGKRFQQLMDLSGQFPEMGLFDLVSAVQLTDHELGIRKDFQGLKQRPFLQNAQAVNEGLVFSSVISGYTKILFPFDEDTVVILNDDPGPCGTRVAPGSAIRVETKGGPPLMLVPLKGEGGIYCFFFCHWTSFSMRSRASPTV